MKLRGLVIGIAVGGFVVAGGVKACAARTTRHTIEDRMGAIVAKKPKLIPMNLEVLAFAQKWVKENVK